MSGAGSSSEFARIERLRARFGSPPGDGLGIGDDAAVLPTGDQRQVISVDAAIEEVHFRRAWMSLREIGERATLAALSDLVAMGARPTCILSSLALPPISESDFDTLIDGIALAAERSGAHVIGGNLAAADALAVHTTVIGECQRPVTRTGARPGDNVFVVGAPGSAMIGLSAFLAADVREDPVLVPYLKAFTQPAIPFAFASVVHEVASAAIDLSDGLLADLAHLTRASKCGASLEFAAVPSLPERARAATLSDVDERKAVLHGGEDYALLFTSAQAAVAGATHIGIITDGNAIRVDGSVVDARGFDHFAD